MGRSRLVMLAAAIPLVVLAACSTSSEPSDTAAGEPSATVQDPDNDADTGEAEEEGEEGGRTEAENEAQEEAELTAERNEAFEAALAEGSVGRSIDITNDPAAGWNGEQLLNKGTDDWEPAVAADPNDPYVYMLTTRYGEPKTCPSTAHPPTCH